MIVYKNENLTQEMLPKQFNIDYWLKTSKATLLAGGRGASIKFKLNGMSFVLRHFLRGGFAANFLYDRYLWRGEQQSRVAQEKQVINYALEHDVPVAECLAYCITQKGIFYKQAIVTRFISNKGTLADVLNRQPISHEAWDTLAAIIKKMHEVKINHVDLNAHNILVDHDGGFHIIDFDKAKIMGHKDQWPTLNINRLKRSLLKIAPKYFDDTQWAVFIKAYQ